MQDTYHFRRTFIDFGQASLKDFRPNRSHSAPPRQIKFNVRSRNDSNASEEIASWIERAKRVLSQNSNTQGASVAEHPSPLAEDSLPMPCNSDKSSDAAEVTTLMVLGIPTRMKLKSIIDVIKVFTTAYDLAYMPSTGCRGRKNLGYVFVNFKNPDGAAEFAKAFQNFQFPRCASKKRCSTKPASCQGFEANMKMHVAQAEKAIATDDCLAIFD